MFLQHLQLAYPIHKHKIQFYIIPYKKLIIFLSCYHLVWYYYLLKSVYFFLAGFGYRHLQYALMFAACTVAYGMRGVLNVAIIAIIKKYSDDKDYKVRFK